MTNIDQVFVDQQIELIREEGFTPFHNKEFAEEIIKLFPRPEFKGAKYIGSMGRDGVSGFIYIPRGRLKLALIAARHLRDAEKIVNLNKRALKRLAPKP